MGLRLVTYTAAVLTLLAVVPTPATPAISDTKIVVAKDKKDKCKRSRKFNEHQVSFGKRAVRAGRCVTDEYGGVKTIGSRPGHHPTGGRALDIMTNTRGSCKAGRPVGFKVANYLMDNAKRLGVMYIIWSNRYWSAGTKKRPVTKWRYMGRGGCTHGHYDHVHVSFK